jgi:hypothetical protein
LELPPIVFAEVKEDSASEALYHRPESYIRFTCTFFYNMDFSNHRIEDGELISNLKPIVLPLLMLKLIMPTMT